MLQRMGKCRGEWSGWPRRFQPGQRTDCLKGKGLLTVARFINLLYTILIFFDPLTFIQLFESNRSEKEKCLTSVCPFSKGESDERISLG